MLGSAATFGCVELPEDDSWFANPDLRLLDSLWPLAQQSEPRPRHKQWRHSLEQDGDPSSCLQNIAIHT